MKRTACIVLLIAILLQAGGLVVFYGVEQSLAKMQMHTLLQGKQDGFELIQLSTSELSKSWTSPNELSYHGKLFDVKSVTVNGTSAKVTAVQDEHEEKIANSINALQSKDKPGKDETSLILQLVELMMLAYVPPAQMQLVMFHIPSELHESYYYSCVLAFPGKIVVPPPKVA